MPYFQSVETENLVILFGQEDLIGDNKISGDCEVILPMLDPVFRIAPITLSFISNRSEYGGFPRRSASNRQIWARCSHWCCHKDPSAYSTRTMTMASLNPSRSCLFNALTLIVLVGGVDMKTFNSLVFPGPIFP